MAEHTAVAAASTLLKVDEFVMTIEFKLTLVRPAVGEVLTCRAEVLRVARSLGFVEAKVHSQRDDHVQLVSTLNATLNIDNR